MKNEELKEQIKIVKELIKKSFKYYSGIISEMKSPDFDLKYYPLLTDGKIQDIFNELKNKHYERERSKAETLLKNCKELITTKTFMHQYEYLKSTPTAKHKLKGFTREEAISIYESVLNLNKQAA